MKKRVGLRSLGLSPATISHSRTSPAPQYSGVQHFKRKTCTKQGQTARCVRIFNAKREEEKQREKFSLTGRAHKIMLAQVRAGRISVIHVKLHPDRFDHRKSLQTSAENCRENRRETLADSYLEPLCPLEEIGHRKAGAELGVLRIHQDLSLIISRRKSARKTQRKARAQKRGEERAQKPGEERVMRVTPDRVFSSRRRHRSWCRRRPADPTGRGRPAI